MQKAEVRRVLDKLSWHAMSVVVGQPLKMTVKGGSPLIGSVTDR